MNKTTKIKDPISIWIEKTDPFDLLYSYGISWAHSIFLRERRGDCEMKITVSGLVRLLDKLGGFDEPPETDLHLPESVLQSVLPQLEEKAKKEAEAHVLALADANFLRNLVAENREKIEEILSDEQ